MVTTRTVIANRYELADDPPIVGGMALVHRGKDLRSGREIAIKTLRPEYARDPESRARLRREAYSLALVKHPSLVTIYDRHENDANTWLILEYVPGPTLKAAVRDDGPMSPERTYGILRNLAGGFAQLHSRGLVHLDVKPQNIILRPDGQPKLIDFGLVQKAGQPQDTENGVAFGTVAYLAPERATGADVDVATDVYSLGCVVYEMLVGQPPFTIADGPEHQREMIRAHLQEIPVAPSTVRPDLGLPTWVDDVVGWAMAKAPADRYRDVATFERMFRAGLEGETPQPAEATAQLPPPQAASSWRSGRIALSRPPAVPSDAAIPELAPVRPSSWATMYRAGGRGIRRTGRLRHTIWRVVAMLLVANLMLGGFLAVRDGPAATVERFLSVAPGADTTVSGDRVRLRGSPGLDAPVLAILGEGTSVDVTGLSQMHDDEQWWPVRVNVEGRPVEGWIYDGGLAGNAWTGRMSWMQAIVEDVSDIGQGIDGAWEDATGFWPF